MKDGVEEVGKVWRNVLLLPLSAPLISLVCRLIAGFVVTSCFQPIFWRLLSVIMPPGFTAWQGIYIVGK